MSEPLVTSPDTPISEGWALRLDYDLLGYISTTLTEGGLGHMPGLSFTVNPDMTDRYIFKLAAPFGSTEGKILPTTDVSGSFTENFHWAIMAGMGYERRLTPFFRANGTLWGSLFSTTMPMIGGGSFESQLPDRTVGGEDFSFSGQSVNTFDLSTYYSFGIEFMPAGRFPLIRIAPTLGIGTLYSPDDDQWNRLRLSLGLSISIGSGDASVAEDSADYDTHAMGVAYETYAKLQAILQTVFMNKIIGDNSQAISDYGFFFGGGDPGAMEDIRVLESASGFFGAMGMANTRKYFLTVGDLNPLPLALEGLGGILILALAENNGGRGTGVGNLLNAAGMTVYYMMGADTPAKRRTLGENMNSRLLGTALIDYALNLVAFGAGALLVNDDSQSDAGWTLLNAGAQVNFGVSFSPDPSNSGAVDRSSFAYIPATYYHGSNDLGDNNGVRSGILINRSFTDWPVYMETRFLTHALRLDNVFKRMGTESGEPYGDAALPSEIAATLGVHYENTWFWVGAGLDTAVQYGGSMGATAGIGASGGLGLQIPFNGREDGSGLALGVRASVHKLLPSGWDAEIVPYLGALIHF
jgi:hypothetical protein